MPSRSDLTDAERHAIDSEIGDLETLAHWMDTRFGIPGTTIRFGLDGLLGLIPGVGDTLLALPSLYIVARARGMGVPHYLQVRMVSNVLLDMLVGAVPLVGDIFDIGFKANIRNVTLLREHFGFPHSHRPDPIARAARGR